MGSLRLLRCWAFVFEQGAEKRHYGVATHLIYQHKRRHDAPCTDDFQHPVKRVPRLRQLLLITVATLCCAFALSPSAASAADGVQAMLDARSQAVEARDVNAFMRTVDPNATDEFKDSQRLAFGGLSKLPLARFELRAATNSGEAPAKALGLAEKYGADDARLVETEQSIRIDSYDDRPSIDKLHMSYVKRDGNWYVAATDDGVSIGLSSARNIWDMGSIDTLTSEHFLTVFRPDQRSRATALTAIAEQAMAKFQQRWPQPWSQRIPIIVPASPQEAASLLDTPADVAQFVAFVSYRTSREPQWTVGAPRMFAQEANLSVNSDESQQDTIVHELAHAATSSMTGPFTPQWLHEGLAEYVRLGKAADIAPGTTGKLELPPAQAFAGSGAELQNAYRDAASAVSFLASIKGSDAPLGVFEAIGSRRLVAGTPAFNTNDAFRSVTGISLDDFIAQWNAKFGRPSR